MTYYVEKPRLGKKGRKKRIAGSRLAYKYAIERINKTIKEELGLGYKRLTKTEAHEIYQRYNGRCVFCGLSLNVQETVSANALYFIHYTPLRYGGKNEIENIVPVCKDHSVKYNASKKLRDDIADIDSIADIIQYLVETTINCRKLKEEENSDFFPMERKLKRLKRILNFKIEDFAINLRYQLCSDWEPENYEFVQEENNSIGDLVSLAASATLDQDAESVSKTKDKIVNQLKQVAKSKQYRVLREK